MERRTFVRTVVVSVSILRHFQPTSFMPTRIFPGDPQYIHLI